MLIRKRQSVIFVYAIRFVALNIINSSTASDLKRLIHRYCLIMLELLELITTAFAKFLCNTSQTINETFARNIPTKLRQTQLNTLGCFVPACDIFRFGLGGTAERYADKGTHTNKPTQ